MHIRKRKRMKIIFWLLPSIVALLIIQIVPGLIGVLSSFTNMVSKYLSNPLEAPFVGLKNYIDIFSPGNPLANTFFESLIATAKFVVYTTIFGIIIGFIGALILNKEFKGRIIVRTILIFPWIIPSVVSYQVWRFLLMQDIGLINKMLISLGIIESGIPWLRGDLAMFSLVYTRVWTAYPFIMVTLLAALQTISLDQYEAAHIDGANALQRFRYITLPGVSTVLKVLILLKIIWGASEFNAAFILFGGNPTGSVRLLSFYIRDYAFSMWDFAHGTAMSSVLMLIMLSFAMIYAKFVMSEKNKNFL